jgi:hypothetical protein
MRWLRVLAAPALSAASLALALLAAECGLRLALPATQRAALPRVGLSEEAQARLTWVERRRLRGPSTLHEFDLPDPVLGWRVRPGVHVRSVKPGSYDVMVTTNDQGLRSDVPVSRAKPDGRMRIGIFGCSLTFGEGVADSETYSRQLAAALPGADVLNFGVHGYGTDQMLLYYEAEGAQYQLDTVVLAFAGFHIARNASGFSFYAKPRFDLSRDGTLTLYGVPVPRPEELAAQEPLDHAYRLVDESVLLRWSWQRVRNWRERSFYRPDAPGWHLTGALIARFAATARAAGSHMVLLNVSENFPQLEPALGELAADLGIGFLNLGPALRDLDHRGVEYRLRNDGHWNAAGHRVVAARLREYLCQTSVLGPCRLTSPEGGLQ